MPTDDVGRRRDLTEFKTKEEAREYALRRYALFHEKRHFHDLFGTAAGILLFFEHLRVTKQMAMMLQVFRHVEGGLTLPLTAHHKFDEFRPVLAPFVSAWRLWRKTATVFTSAFSPSVLDGHVEDYVRMMPAPDAKGEITTFPLHFGVEDKKYSVCVPVGLAALIEGNAQALQRSLAEAEHTDELSRTLVSGVLPRQSYVRSHGDIEAVLVDLEPYDITDFMIRRYLRSRKRNGQFQRRSIFVLSDIALNEGSIAPHVVDDLGNVKTFAIAELGGSFHNALRRADVSQIENGEISYKHEVQQRVFSGLLRDILDFKKPHELPPPTSLPKAFDIVESTVRHHIVAPLMDIRLRTRNEVFWSAEEYARLLKDLPAVPCISFSGDSVRFADYMTDLMCDAWAKYVMVAAAIFSIMEGESKVTCFRATKERPGLSSLNWCREGSCEKHLSANACGSWPSEKPLPRCGFVDTLHQIGAE